MPFAQRRPGIHSDRNRHDSADFPCGGEETSDASETAPARRLLRDAGARAYKAAARRGAVMNGRSASSPRPVPGPFCALYSPLLPLLGSRALSPEEEASLREHLA